MLDKQKNIILIVLYMLVTVTIMIINIAKNDTVVSETERRKLASFPKVSIDKVLDGSFTNQFEKYTMDQFIKRDDFRRLKTFVELNVFKKKDVNNVYVNNNNLIKLEYLLNEKSVLNLTSKMNYIKEKYLKNNNIYFSIIPDKNYFSGDNYLKMDYEKMQQIMCEELENMKYIDIFDCLSLEDYYRTDTHWKQENLGKVVDKISYAMGFKNRINTEFKKYNIGSFNGVYAGQLQVGIKEDNLNIMSNEILENSIVYNFETQKETLIYDIDKLRGYDKYDVFLSGATTLLTIENTMAKTDRELVVFRDSFGSSLIPLFTEAYKKITVIDTRYIGQDYLDKYVEFGNKDVLFIYSTLVINNSFSLK